MTRWEYRTLMYRQIADFGGEADSDPLGHGRLERGLNRLGADGWELIWFSGTWYYFKRPVVGSVPPRDA